MSCKFNDNGKYALWYGVDPDEIEFEYIINSCDDTGVCLDDDEYPDLMCEDFEEA